MAVSCNSLYAVSSEEGADGWLGDSRLPILRYLLARVADPADAADLTQETLLRAYRALSRGEQPRRPLSWLVAIARNVLLEALRTQRYERQCRERLAHCLAPDWQTPWTVEWHEHLEQRLIVGDAVEKLPADLQEAVVLRYFAELPVAVVARRLAIPPGAVKTRLWRARQVLHANWRSFIRWLGWLREDDQ